MVKLVRLTSENDCIFNANLDSDLVVGEDAQIAVQNLTFETIFPLLDIGENEAEILFNLDRNTYLPDTSRTVGLLDVKNYDSTNYQTFFPAMEKALNDTLTLNQGAVDAPAPEGKYMTTGQYVIGDINGDGGEHDKKAINFILSPVIHPEIIGDNGRLFDPQNPEGLDGDGEATLPAFQADNALFSISKDVANNEKLEILNNALAAGDILEFGGYKKPVGAGSSADLDAFIYPTSRNVQWCKGSSILYARIGSLPVGGNKDEEGFAIGLSKSQIDGRNSRTIQTASRDYEIRCYRRNDNYQFITPDSAHIPADSVPAFTPFGANAQNPDGVGANDVMMIEKSGQEIIGSVITAGPGYEYANLPLGGDWTQAPVAATENFDEIDLGDVATYRRTQVGSALVQWWEATSATDWNLYNTKPVVGQAPDNTATIVLATGVITIGGSTFTPAVVPPTVDNGRKRQLFRYIDDDRDAPLYPYVYVCGDEGPAAGGTVINWIGLTVDPEEILKLDIDQDDYPDNDNPYLTYLAPEYGNVWGSAEQPDGGRAGMSQSVADIVAKLPQLDDDLYNLALAQNLSTVLSISKDILRFMGFSGPEYNGTGYYHFKPKFNAAYDNQWGFELMPDNEFYISASDNYVVILDSHPVFSYDCSTIPSDGKISTNPTAAKSGKRMNIIATIPDNDNTNGVVEFDASELVFIDLDNNYKQNISNIRARVLNKQLEKIETVGTSVMTLLIKDTKKE